MRIGIGNPHRRAVAARQQVRAHHVSRRSIGNALAFGDQHETVGVARTRFTESTMTDLDAIRAEIDLTAQRGYVEDREENEQSIWCHGAAILGADGRAVGCISISMPMFRRDADAQGRYIEPLLAACRTIAARLGPVAAR